MNLEPTDEQAALRDTVRRFLAEKAGLAAHVRPMLDDAAGTTVAMWRGLADLGTTGLLIPQEYDGAGMTMVEAGVVCEELGAALHPGPWLSSAVAAPRAVARLSAETEAAALLISIADGSTIASVGPLSPGNARPIAVERGDGLVLRGDIDDIPDAAAADVLLVLAEDRDGTGVYVAETSDPHLDAAPQPGIDQTRKQFRVSLDDVPEQRLASAPPHAVEALVDDVIVASAADAVGAAQKLIDMTVEYAKLRKQFGRPIGSFQAVAHLCADMFETVELARSGVIHALWAADNADREERHLAAVRAKAFAGRLAAVGDIAIQIFGGIGYTWEHDAHLYLKRLLSWSSFLGGPDGYLEELGARIAQSTNGMRSTA